MFAVLLDTVHVSKPVHMTVDCIFHVFVLCIFDLCTNDDMFFLCQVFRKNFLEEWRLLMTPEERGILVDLDRCDFRQIKKHLVEQARRRKERYNLVLELCDGKLLDLFSSLCQIIPPRGARRRKTQEQILTATTSALLMVGRRRWSDSGDKK